MRESEIRVRPKYSYGYSPSPSPIHGMIHDRISFDAVIRPERRQEQIGRRETSRLNVSMPNGTETKIGGRFKIIPFQFVSLARSVSV